MSLQGESKNRLPSLPAALLVALLCGGGCAAVVLAVHAANPRALLSTHGFLHSAIVQRFPADQLPPENPYFAGEPLAYYWVFQWMASLLVRSAKVDPLHALEWLVVAGFPVLFISALLLARRLYASLYAGMVMGLFALLGANPLGPLVYVLRGMQQGWQVFDPDPKAMFGSYIYMSQVGARLYGPNLPYFFNITSRGPALACVLLVLYALHLQLRTPSAKHAMGLTLALALCTAVSPIFGLAVAGTLGAARLLLWVMQLRRGAATGPVDSADAFPWSALIALALGPVLMLPTYSHLFHLSEGGSAFVLFTRLGFKVTVAVVLGATPVFVLALLGHRGLLHPDRTYSATLILAAMFLLVPSAAIWLPVDNACNFFQAAMVMLAVPAAGIVAAPFHDVTNGSPHPRRERPSIWRKSLPMLFLPAFVLIVHAYTGRAPIGLEFDGMIYRRTPAERAPMEYYTWLRERTEPDAVVVMDPRRKVALQGNVDELPALTGRVLFVGSDSYLTSPYADRDRRKALAVKLVSGERLTVEESGHLAALNRPVYVLVYDADDETHARIEVQLGKPARRTDSGAVYRWAPQTPMEEG